MLRHEEVRREGKVSGLRVRVSLIFNRVNVISVPSVWVCAGLLLHARYMASSLGLLVETIHCRSQ